MANYPRKTAKVFGSTAGANPDGIGVFGSLANGSPAYSTDIEVVQNDPNWEGGLSSAVVVGDTPAIEDENAVHYVASSQIAYILQKGVPEYDAGTTYYTGNFCSVSGLIYYSTGDNNTGNTPAYLSSHWLLYQANLLKGENLFRNAGFQVAQRGTSGTLTAGASEVYTADGWICHCSGNDLDWATGYGNVSSYLSFTAGHGDVSDFYVKQRIESSVMKAVGQVSAGQSTYSSPFVTVQLTISGPNGTAPKLTLNVANSPDDFSSVTATSINAIVMPGIGTGTLANSYTFNINGIANYTNGIEIIYDLGALPSTDVILISLADISVTPNLWITGVQGTPPLPQVRPITEEVPINERYYQSWGGDQTIQNLFAGVATSTTAANFMATYTTTMRAVPSLSASANSDFEISGNTVTGIPSSNASTKSILFSATVASGLTSGSSYFLDTVNANARFNLSSEL